MAKVGVVCKKKVSSNRTSGLPMPERRRLLISSRPGPVAELTLVGLALGDWRRRAGCHDRVLS